MRRQTKFPPWLARRGYSVRLKRDLLQVMIARRGEFLGAKTAAEPAIRFTGNVIVLEHYRALRVIVPLG